MKIIKSLFLILCISMGIAGTIAAQTADEIIAESIEATGGMDTWKAMTTRTIKGSMSMNGMVLPGTITEMAPDKLRMDFDFQGKQLVQAYDGETPWSINPFIAEGKPQVMSVAEAAQMKDEPFESPLLDYAAKGHTVELLEKEVVEGKEAFVIKLTKSNGSEELHFFDAESYMPVMKRKNMDNGPAKDMEVETHMSDYRTVNGAKFPFLIQAKINGQIVQSIAVDDLLVNPQIDPEIFAFPGSPSVPVGAEDLPAIEQKAAQGGFEKAKKKN